MRINFIGILITILAARANSESCEESRQLESTCGTYCFKVVKTILEHTRALQKQVESFDIVQKTEQMIKLASVETLLQERNEQLHGSCKILETELQKHVEYQDKHKANMLEKIESTKSLFYVQFNTLKQNLQTLEGKFEDQCKNLSSIVKVNDKPDIGIFEKIGSKYYYIGDNEELNWFAAAAKCIKLGGHLASVQNQQEFNAIRAKLTKPGYWLDINDLAEEGKYMSSTTGEKAVFIRWDSINPNNQDNAENCVELGINHDYEMNDLTCLYRNNFICEKKFDN